MKDIHKIAFVLSLLLLLSSCSTATPQPQEPLLTTGSDVSEGVELEDSGSDFADSSDQGPADSTEPTETAEAADSTEDAASTEHGNGTDSAAASGESAGGGTTAAPSGKPEPADPSAAVQTDAPSASSGQTQTVSPSAPKPEHPSEPAVSAPPTPPDSVSSGIWETADGLYYVQEDGTCLVSSSKGYLTFGSDGRYTSGDVTLDKKINALIANVCPDITADRESRLRLVYNHIRDSYRYLSMNHYETGSTYWGNSAALTLLNQGKGNCYNFTALFTACARRLGYQAYNIAGQEYSATNDHAWTMINWPDGNTYLFDVQLEYAYRYMYTNKPSIDMFKVTGGNGSYNGFAYFFPS